MVGKVLFPRGVIIVRRDVVDDGPSLAVEQTEKLFVDFLRVSADAQQGDLLAKEIESRRYHMNLRMLYIDIHKIDLRQRREDICQAERTHEAYATSVCRHDCATLSSFNRPTAGITELDCGSRWLV